jgi:hypothetical protein
MSGKLPCCHSSRPGRLSPRHPCTLYPWLAYYPIIDADSFTNIRVVRTEHSFIYRPNMAYQLLAGGYRDSYTILTFDPSNAKLKTVSDSPAPQNASWLEPSPKTSGTDGRVVYSLSEDPDKGKGLSLLIKGDKVEVTGERMTNGAPAHGKFLSASRWYPQD